MPIGVLGLLLINAGLFVVQRLLQPKVKRPKSPDFETPTSDEGQIIPGAFGVVELVPNMTLVIDQRAVPREQDLATLYYARIQGVLCHGPLLRVIEIKVGEKPLSLEPISRGQSVSSNPILSYVVTPAKGANGWDLPTDGTALELFVSAMKMFGGFQSQGGIAGIIHVIPGRTTQDISSLTAYARDADASSVPTVAMIEFGADPDVSWGYPLSGPFEGQFLWTANTPTPRGVSVIAARYPNALLAVSEASGAGAIGMDANPIEVLYEALTDPVWGMGWPTSRFNTSQWQAAATEVRAPTDGAAPIGVSGALREQVDGADVVGDLMDAADALPYINPTTGLVEVTLLRGSGDFVHDPATLLEITASNSRDFELLPESWPDTLNEVRINYRRFDGGSFGDNITETIENFRWATRTELVTPTHLPFRIYQLNGRNITNVVAANTTQSLTLTVGADQDYTFDAVLGQFTFYNHGNIDEGDTLTVTYSSTPGFVGFRDATWVEQNLANIRATDEVRSETYEYPFYTNELVVQQKAKLLLRQRTIPRKRARWTMSRSGYALHPGSVVAPNRPDINAALDGTLPFRVLSVGYGTLEQGRLTIDAMEDVWAYDTPTASLGDSTGSGAGTDARTAPDMGGIGCGSGGADVIRVALFAGDPTFTIEVERADDASGTGAVTITAAGGIAGTSTHVDDAQAGGTTKYYRARHIRSGWTDGAWKGWIACTAASSGSGSTPTYVEPTVHVATDACDAAEGGVTLTIVDPQNQVATVEFRTKVGTAPYGDWEEAA